MATTYPVLAQDTEIRERLRQKAVEGLKQVFPLTIRDHTIHLDDVQVHTRDFGPNEQKRALLEGATLHEPVKATLVMKDKSGNVVDQVKNYTLLHLPYFTERHSFIVDGNEYQVSNQIRMKTGVYARRRANGELEAAFNTARGSANFRLSLDPREGLPLMEFGTTTIPLYPVLRKLGVSHEQIASAWGADVAAKNEKKLAKKGDASLHKLYDKLVHASRQTAKTPEDEVRQVHEVFSRASMDPEVNETTLGHPHASVSPGALLDASKKLLAVYKSGEDVDDRDSLAFKTFHSVDDFVKERIGLDARTIAMKVRTRAANKTKIREILPPAPFTPGIRSFLTQSQLSSIPTQINPMEIIDHAVKVTSLGEGGISSERAIPMEARQIHPTHFGILDPVRTPECVSADTEVFTSDGWVPFPQVTKETHFACNLDGRLEYHRATSLFAERYRGTLHGVKTGTKAPIEYLVTPNHRVWSRPEFSGALYRMDRADIMHGRGRWFAIRHLPAEGDSRLTKFRLPAAERRSGKIEPAREFDVRDWAEFLGWYLSEGSFTRTDLPQYQVQISQCAIVNPDCCAEIEALLERMHVRYTRTQDQRTYIINSRQLTEYVAQFGHCEDKFIPAYMFDAPVAARKALWRALLMGDGRFGTQMRATGKSQHQEVLCTTSAQLAADFERLSVGLGLPTRTHKYVDSREARYLPVFEVRVVQAREKKAFGSKGHYYTVPYDGMVYCAQVPGGMLYVRRNKATPLWTGNSFKAGVDVRVAMLAGRDDRGNLYTPVYDVHKKEYRDLSAKEMAAAVVAFPGQPTHGTVEVMKDGEVQRVPAAEVQYRMFHSSQLYSPSSNLIPFMESIQGNRATMGSKMQTQALPLVDREVPLVQVGTMIRDEHMRDHPTSFERELGKLIVPIAPVAGRVARIDSQYIYIQPHGQKQADHAEDRLRERTTLNKRILKQLRAAADNATEAGVTPGNYYLELPLAQGYAVYKPGSDKRLVLASILAPHMTPKGEPLPREHFEKAAAVLRQKTVNGLTVKIELEPGDVRSGTNDAGEKWSKTMKVCYGYVPKTVGDDGEAVDVYLKEDGFFAEVYVVHQRKKDGSHDEDKCMVGFSNLKEAVESYTYHGPPNGFGGATVYAWDDFADDYLAERKKEASDDNLVKVPYSTNFPFASKTYLNHDVLVKEGDDVEQDQVLTDSNFTRDGELALGKNMRVGYMAYYGLNSNDAVVISETAAKKLTSEHMYKEVLDVDPDVTLGRDIHKQYFGGKYTNAQYAKLDKDGVVKTGTKVYPHDLVIAGVRRGKLSSTDVLLGNFKKTLMRPYHEESREWHHDFEGEVVDVYKAAKRVVVTIKTREPMRVGDKLSGRYGNKGVVSHIVPDHQMVHTVEDQRPVDILYTSAGVISRINPAQIIETAVAKVAEKTGRPIVVENFSGRDNVRWAKDLLKEHGVKDKETVHDPVSGKTIPGVLVGPQYTLRLFKTTDSNYSARGTGGYDVNRQPTKGGDTGAKGVGQMEFNALVAHDAKNVLRETATLKGEQNDEFWRAVQLGLPLPPLRSPFVFDKLTAMLLGAGINPDKRGHIISLKPLTDADTKKLSRGAIENEKLVRAKDLAPERGGFFDPSLTGGASGTHWAHVDLAEPVVNPVFAEPVRRLLGYTNKEFEAVHFRDGGGALKRRLNAINVPERLREVKAQIKTAKGSELDNLVKQAKYLAALSKYDLRPGDAYVISKLPVIPPIMRPILPGKGGQEMVVGDSNYLYQNAFLHNKELRAQNDRPVLPPDEHAKLRENLYTAVGAVIGTHNTDNQKLEKRNVKGFLEHLTGKTTPKSSFFQKKIVKRQQDLSGRGTAVPDGSLGMDQIGLPEDMLWEMFGKFVIARLVRRGFSALQATDLLDKRSPVARDALLAEVNERPVMVNRAPTLHRYNIVGAYAVPVPGKTIRVNPFIEKGMNLDYDGDALQVHAPALPRAVEDVKRMTLSNLIFSDKQKSELMVAPSMEAVLGIHLATEGQATGVAHKFKDKAEALAAYKRGEVKLTDTVEVG